MASWHIRYFFFTFFFVPSLCKLNHIRVCFIQINTKSAYSLQGRQCFFWSHPRCFGPLGKFQHNIKISIKTARVSRLSASYGYDGTQHVQLTLSNLKTVMTYYLCACLLSILHHVQIKAGNCEYKIKKSSKLLVKLHCGDC